MKIFQILNFVFAMIGLIGGIYLIYSATLRIILKRLDRMEEDILAKLSGKPAK